MYIFKNKKFNKAIMNSTENGTIIELKQNNVKIATIINSEMMSVLKTIYPYLKYSLNPPKCDEDHKCLQLSYKGKISYVKAHLDLTTITKLQLDEYFLDIEKFILKTEQEIHKQVYDFNNE